MVVPVDVTLAARIIRAHELAHATWTPTRSPASICSAYGVTHDALQRAEDCRLGYGLIDSDVPDYWSGTLTDEDVARLEQEGQQLLAEHGDGIRDSIAKRLAFQVVSLAMTVDRARLIDLADKLGSDPMRSLAKHVAEAAEETLFPRGRYRHQQALRRSRSGAGPKVSAAVPFRRTIALAHLLDRLFPPEGAPSSGRDKPSPRSGQPSWGQLTVEEPPRCVVARLAKLRTVRRPSDEGTSIRRLDRLLVDERVFASKPRQRPRSPCTQGAATRVYCGLWRGMGRWSRLNSSLHPQAVATSSTASAGVASESGGTSALDLRRRRHRRR